MKTQIILADPSFWILAFFAVICILIGAVWFLGKVPKEANDKIYQDACQKRNCGLQNSENCNTCEVLFQIFYCKEIKGNCPHVDTSGMDRTKTCQECRTERIKELKNRLLRHIEKPVKV